MLSKKAAQSALPPPSPAPEGIFFIKLTLIPSYVWM